MNLRSIIEHVSFRNDERNNSSYMKKIFEGMSFDLPIEPSETPWSRTKEDTLKISYEFKTRENTKDFVASVQELEDRMQHFVLIKIERNNVFIEEQNVKSMSDEIKDFYQTVEKISENFNARR